MDFGQLELVPPGTISSPPPGRFAELSALINSLADAAAKVISARDHDRFEQGKIPLDGSGLGGTFVRDPKLSSGIILAVVVVVVIIAAALLLRGGR